MSDVKVAPAVTHGVDDLEDGDLVVGGADPNAFVIEDGTRRPFESVEAFMAAGHSPEQVKVVDDPRLQLMPLGPAFAAAAPSKAFDSGQVFLGAGHYMRTWGALDLGSGRIAAQTFIQTVTWFGGYHGAAYVIFSTTDDVQPVYRSQVYRYGVDGTAVGTSQRTSAWWEGMTPDQAAQVHTIKIFHSWSPDAFQTILDKWVAAGKSVAELAQSVGSVAKVVGTVV
jgi:hypothetical protein